MGRRRLLLLWALLGLLRPAAPEAQSEQRTYENVKLLQISMHPTAAVKISSKEEESLEGQDDSKSAEETEAKEEEKTLNGLVDALLDMVDKIPTAKAGLSEQTIPLPTEPSVVMTTVREPSQSETVDTVWQSMRPTTQEEQTEASEAAASETVVVASKIPSASPTAIWEIQNGTSESVALHTDETTAEKPLVSVSLLVEKATTQKINESFDQLTNGAVSNLEQSLENVQKLNGILDTFTNQPADQESEDGKAHKKPTAEDILDLIEKLIKTLKSTPSFVKEDRNLYKYVQTAKTYIKDALELTEKAEKTLPQENPASPSTPPPAQEKAIPPVPEPEPEPLPEPTMTIQPISPPPMPLAEKAEEAQVEMGKLKAFINLLYGFSPHLTAYTQNTAHKKVAEDIMERALEVLHAIKSVFCGSEEAQSKRALKQLLKEDMELVNQAMKAKRAA